MRAPDPQKIEDIVDFEKKLIKAGERSGLQEEGGRIPKNRVMIWRFYPEGSSSRYEFEVEVRLFVERYTDSCSVEIYCNYQNSNPNSAKKPAAWFGRYFCLDQISSATEDMLTETITKIIDATKS